MLIRLAPTIFSRLCIGCRKLPSRTETALPRPFPPAGAAKFLGSTLFPLWVSTFATYACADVEPNRLFTNGVVLQREQPVTIWGTASDGEHVTVMLASRTAATIARSGKWRIELPPMASGGPYKLTVSGRNRVVISNVLIGDVYVCSGQSNMEWPLSLTANSADAVATAKDPLLHFFVVPRGVSDTPVAELSGKWQQSTPESARGFSAVAFVFGRSLRKTLGVPVGLIQSSWSGSTAQAWTSRLTLLERPSLAPMVENYDREVSGYWHAADERAAAYDKAISAAIGKGTLTPEELATLPKQPSNPIRQTSPTTLYNAMIYPLIPFRIRGVLWYQGESNTGAAYQYGALFAALIAGWRRDWNQGDLPFLFVQLAPFLRRRDGPQESAWAELRDAQLEVSRTVANTAMVVITDLGDEEDIHPREKQVVGERLALAARRLIYKESVEACGPTYESHEIQGSKIVLHFQNVAGGLFARGGEALRDFTICGEDQKFVPATVEIQGDTIIVSSSEVAKPTAVRYGWSDYPQGNLRNKAGLPASPFRTDNFRLSTQPK